MPDVKTLVDHWKAEKEAFTARKATAEKDKETATKALAAAQDALAAEDKILTDLTRDIAATRGAFASAGSADAELLAQQLTALIVRQQASKGRRLQAGKKLDEAQVEADVVAERFADVSVGLGDATAKLTAAEAAQAKRDERSQKVKSKEFQEALAKAEKEAGEWLEKANERIKVVPKGLQAAAKKGYDGENAALRQAKADATKAQTAVRDAAGPLDPLEEKARALAEAEEKLSARLESSLADLATATASLKKVAGNEKDPPLLSKAEKDAVDGAEATTAASATATPAETYSDAPAAPTSDARTPVAQTRAKGDSEAAPPPAAAAKDPKATLIELARTAAEKAQAYEQKRADKTKAAKPGDKVEEDPEVVAARKASEAAAKAYDDAVKAYQPSAAVQLPDKAWQAVLDVVAAADILTRVKDAALPDTLVTEVEKTLAVFAQGKAAAAKARWDAEAKKYEAHRTAKLLEKAQAAYEGRLLAAARGDL